MQGCSGVAHVCVCVMVYFATIVGLLDVMSYLTANYTLYMGPSTTNAHGNHGTEATVLACQG